MTCSAWRVSLPNVQFGMLLKPTGRTPGQSSRGHSTGSTISVGCPLATRAQRSGRASRTRLWPESRRGRACGEVSAAGPEFRGRGSSRSGDGDHADLGIERRNGRSSGQSRHQPTANPPRSALTWSGPKSSSLSKTGGAAYESHIRRPRVVARKHSDSRGWLPCNGSQA